MFYPRLRRIGERVLQAIEADYGLEPVSGTPLAERIRETKLQILERVAREFGAAPLVEMPLPQQMRAMFNAVWASAAEVEWRTDDDGHRRHLRRLVAADLCLRDLAALAELPCRERRWWSASPPCDS